jgi:ribosomal protein S18 acetylase RimI-like enzyme
VDVRSLAFRTDLALLARSGTEIDDLGDHLVIRTPRNPAFWWGTFLLLAQVPPAQDTDAWLDRFAIEFPAAEHIAIGFDGVDGQVEDLAAFSRRGLRCEAAAVMTAAAVHEPPRPNRSATYRELRSEEDWSQSVDLRVICRDEHEEPNFMEFATRKVESNRALVRGGHGAWFGAFVDGVLVSQMGLFSASPGLARFQTVETHPDFRGRGLAGTLVHHVSRYGFTELKAHTLVMVADPDYLAIRVYRSVGFTDSERQLQAEQPPVMP